MKRHIFSVLSCLCLFSVIFCGCNMPQKTVMVPTETVPEIIEDTPEPTETPTPLPQKEKIAFLPSADVPAVTESLTRALEPLCGDVYECRTIENEDGITEDINFVIFAQEPTALDSVMERFPQTHFIVVSAPQMNHRGAWVIQYDQAYLPFLAGLAAASNAYDWRCAGLLPDDAVLWGENAEEYFSNGAHYLCGNCRPSLAPYVNFPIVISLPGGSASGDWSSRFDEAQRNFIYTVFLSDEAISEELLQKLVSLNVQMIGVSAPPAGLENNWLASINFDWNATLRQIITRTENGETEGTMPLILTVVPGALTEDFSSGKTLLLQRTYDDLLSGLLSPYTPVKEYTEQ